MMAAANNKSFAKRVKIAPAVAAEFIAADKAAGKFPAKKKAK